MTVGAWSRDHVKKAERMEKATENWIAFEILSVLRLPWWVDVMVNLSGFYVAVVFFL